MSRTKHHGAPSKRQRGFEYWSRRNPKKAVLWKPGRYSKTKGHRIERRWPSKNRDLHAELGEDPPNCPVSQI